MGPAGADPGRIFRPTAPSNVGTFPDRGDPRHRNTKDPVLQALGAASRLQDSNGKNGGGVLEAAKKTGGLSLVGPVGTVLGHRAGDGPRGTAAGTPAEPFYLLQDGRKAVREILARARTHHLVRPASFMTGQSIRRNVTAVMVWRDMLGTYRPAGVDRPIYFVFEPDGTFVCRQTIFPGALSTHNSFLDWYRTRPIAKKKKHVVDERPLQESPTAAARPLEVLLPALNRSCGNPDTSIEGALHW